MWTIKTCVREQGMSPNQAAEYVPYSHTTVYDWLDAYESGDPEKREWVETVDRVIG
ncbi:helix-turn-helix domain-containing protein [Natranaeroarchaeum aerophilus]|uniref:Helix-turn-helix domain-containing protein n=1 Tax=Natranaeroarchaeum aerophilus TaxID=2917711 RepID=A0AAE3FT42_9EURY|nr:helix-turn-helix domain-containing protein [Natranaeroarchaeum aerophilus]MCL9815092.1 helix-turn-helix domain-containing protein [Natranaeroarchaeum aerophilus]